MRVRPAAVSGLFYPEEPDALRAAVTRYIADANVPRGNATVVPPKAIIAPHAGYPYSGPIAGSAYASLTRPDVVERVVLLGPAHRVAFEGLAVSSLDAFVTPLGPIEVDRQARERAVLCPGVAVDDRPHAGEHSLEVHLPFLQCVLDANVPVLPMVVGRADARTVATALDAVWGGPETLVVVSSDLSHYESYARARVHDRRTADAVVTGAINLIGPADACGAYPIRGLLVTAKEHHLETQLLDLRNSGNTAGPRDRVVGYGAFALTDHPAVN